MKQRLRSISLQIYVNEEEKEIIEKKMREAQIKSFSNYARRMLLHGMIIVPEWDCLKKVHRQLVGIGTNINQIARRANETRNIYQSDVQELQEKLGDIYAMFHDCMEFMKKVDKGFDR